MSSYTEVLPSKVLVYTCWRLKDTQDLRKGESLFRHFGSFLVIGVYLEINYITVFSLYLEIESFGLPWSLWTLVHFIRAH